MYEIFVLSLSVNYFYIHSFNINLIKGSDWLDMGVKLRVQYCREMF